MRFILLSVVVALLSFSLGTRAMEPDWQRLAKLVHSDFKGCLVVSVDCEATADLCQAFSVQGYPTIMLLQATQVPPDKHKRLGTRLPLLCPYSCVTHF